MAFGIIGAFSAITITAVLQYVSMSKIAYENSFGAIEKFELLPGLNEDISRALEIISNLQKIFEGVWADFERAIESMTELQPA